MDLRADQVDASDLCIIGERGNTRVRGSLGKKNIWVTLELDGVQIVALRIGPHIGQITNLQHWSDRNDTVEFDFTTPVGAMRARLEFVGTQTLHCKTSLLPLTDTLIAAAPRDLLMLAGDGEIFTTQRGLRTGIVFAGSRTATPFTMFYLQNFSALSDYFRATKQTPADSVGGRWPELGFALPTSDDTPLPMGREVVVSDVYVALSDASPSSEDAIAALYLDMFAEVYVALERPQPAYHPWNERARDALRDLTLSPDCSYVRQGQRYLKPYVGDDTKPPESMVQFTVATNVGEYDRWRGAESQLGGMLRKSAPTFFNQRLGSVVRWLPGERFDPAQAEENMSHEAMDSWYLLHSLFNLFRLGREGDVEAKGIFEKSLAYAIRVAHRFNYRWPIFFNLESLDIIRAEAAPGKGGETDVAGLYALVMIHAFESFGDESYLNEAEAAAAQLRGFGFNLAYQLNTTGFAAEAALRLWRTTNKREYLGLAELCVANVFDNMWAWNCDYGYAAHYQTFFGLFPLRDAPYIAPYEELEAHAKFQEFLTLGGADIRPSLRLLIAEYQKYSLDRCWYYYPDVLPENGLSEKARNGRVERTLSVPLEDLQDGLEQSGQVGQEIYGAGLPFVLTARHYMHFARARATVFCSYPMFDFSDNEDGTAVWRADGDPRCEAQLRVFPTEKMNSTYVVSVCAGAGIVLDPIPGTLSPGGHAVFTIRGGQTVELRCSESGGGMDGIIIGPLTA
jgi:hypothetical protein